MYCDGCFGKVESGYCTLCGKKVAQPLDENQLQEHLSSLQSALYIEHIGIAVKDLVAAAAHFTRLLGTPPYKAEIVESEGVKTLFFRVGQTKIELLVATSSDSPIARFIERRGEGIHHIAIAAASAQGAYEYVKRLGVRLLNEAPKQGADGKWIFFLHPKDVHGVLMEFCSDLQN